MFFQKTGHNFPILFLVSKQCMPTAWKCHQLRIGNVGMRVFCKIVIYQAVIQSIVISYHRRCAQASSWAGMPIVWLSIRSDLHTNRTQSNLIVPSILLRYKVLIKLSHV